MNAFVIIRKYIEELDKTIENEMSLKNQQYQKVIEKKITKEQFGQWLGHIKGLQTARKILDKQIYLYEKNGGKTT